MFAYIFAGLCFGAFGAALASWGIRQANRWLPNTPLKARLLLGSLTAPVFCLGFVVFVFVYAMYVNGWPPSSSHQGPLSEPWRKLSGLLGFLGLNWAGGLAQAWRSYRVATEPKARPPFPLSLSAVLFGAFTILSFAYVVPDGWIEHGKISSRTALLSLGCMWAVGYLAAPAWSLIALYRWTAHSRPIRLNGGQRGLILIGVSTAVGLMAGLIDGRGALALGVYCLLSACFSIGVGTSLLVTRKARSAAIEKGQARIAAFETDLAQRQTKFEEDRERYAEKKAERDAALAEYKKATEEGTAALKALPPPGQWRGDKNRHLQIRQEFGTALKTAADEPEIVTRLRLQTAAMREWTERAKELTTSN